MPLQKGSFLWQDIPSPTYETTKNVNLLLWCDIEKVQLQANVKRCKQTQNYEFNLVIWHEHDNIPLSST
jgi:hypothetical protein